MKADRRPLAVGADAHLGGQLQGVVGILLRPIPKLPAPSHIVAVDGGIAAAGEGAHREYGDAAVG